MDILTIGKDIFQLEIDELISLQHRLDESFVKIVEVISKCEGKVVIVGIGKSGIIGKKIAATFMSTGTTTVFMNAAEGLHGDLGMITSQDTVIILSNSGSSEEVLKLLPSLKIIKPVLIAFTGNKNSPLAKEMDLILDIGVSKEACPLNIAPTSSTTALLVIGDAIAIALMKLKDFKKENFAVFHPGGALGKKLLTKIKNLMIQEYELPKLYLSSTASEVVKKLTETRVGAVCIVEQNNTSKILGIITDGDLKRHLSDENLFFSLKAKEMMTSNPKTISQEEMAYEALDKMESGNLQISFLPVLDSFNNLCGGLRIHDLKFMT